MKSPTFSIRYSVIALLLFFASQMMAQQTLIKVIDNETSDPCIYTNVVLSGLDGLFIDAGATNENGEITFDLNKNARICVSFVGYKTYIDTITPGENISIRLQSDFINMEAVVVTGQYQPKAVDKSIYKIDVIDGKTMQERGVNNLAEALSNETSIRLSVDPATGTSIIMQGMGGENIKYLIDGVPIVGRVRGNIDLSQINMENVDHIEIVHGPMSVQYGTSAIAGVINIITKKNNYFSNIVKGNSYIDSKGHYNFGLYASLIRDKHTFTVSGNRNLFQGVDIDLNADSHYEEGHNRYMEFKPKLVYNGNLEYQFKKESFQLKLKSQYMNTLVKNYGNVPKTSIAADEDYYTTRITNSLVLSDKITESISYNIIGAYTYYDRYSEEIIADLANLTKIVSDTSGTSFNNILSRGDFTYAKEGANFFVMAGWDINYDNGEGDKMEENAEMGNYAIFLNGQYSPLSNLSFQPGIRFIHNSIYDAPVAPSINLRWSILDNLGLRVSYSKGFRAPSLKELYLDFHDSNHDVRGNKDLKAETTNSYNASMDFTKQSDQYRLKFEPKFFFNDGKNVIALYTPDQSSNTTTYINLARRKTIGGELNTSFRHKSGFQIGAGFTRVGAAIDADEDGDGSREYLPMIFYNNYSFNTRYSIAKIKTTIIANLKYYGKTPSLAAIPESQGGGYYNIFVEPYGDLEITLSKNLWKSRLNVVIGGKNLLNNYIRTVSGYRDFGDPDYEEFSYGPSNYGRTYFLKMNLRFIK